MSSQTCLELHHLALALICLALVLMPGTYYNLRTTRTSAPEPLDTATPNPPTTAAVTSSFRKFFKKQHCVKLHRYRSELTRNMAFLYMSGVFQPLFDISDLEDAELVLTKHGNGAYAFVLRVGGRMGGRTLVKGEERGSRREAGEGFVDRVAEMVGKEVEWRDG
jgi:hypothetical protein